jgi:hypothetical protein
MGGVEGAAGGREIMTASNGTVVMTGGEILLSVIGC